MAVYHHVPCKQALSITEQSLLVQCRLISRHLVDKHVKMLEYGNLCSLLSFQSRAY